MSQLYSFIVNRKKNGKSCITTCVGNELHELGIRMIADLLEYDGWRTMHLGANVPIHSIIKTIKENEIELIAVSLTITYHLDQLIKLIDAIRSDEELKKIKIIVGGYPFNKDSNLWKQIKADGYARDAERAVSLANQLTEGI
ncbi:MAG: cobalamin B12-binding domain-containing protein [Clostridiales bacterium]|nr:cobalamin B12-binding domain-containing protein [Clostridiales bacterium]